MCLQYFDAVCWVAGKASWLENWWDAGVVMSLGQCADLHMAQLMPLPLTVSYSNKSRLVLPFWCRLTGLSQTKSKRAVKHLCVCVCVCVCACVGVGVEDAFCLSSLS